MRTATPVHKLTTQQTWRRLAGLVIAVLLTGLLTACSTTQSPSTQLNDAAIATKVKAKLTGDPEINPFNINVDTEDGVVTLIGRVPTEADKQEAERLARNTKGVRDVDNRLKVGKTDTG